MTPPVTGNTPDPGQNLIVAGFTGSMGGEVRFNDFYNPLIYINSESKMTLPLGLTALRGMLNSGNESALIASVLLTLIAPLILYVFGQRYLVEGITLGGLKG